MGLDKDKLFGELAQNSFTVIDKQVAVGFQTKLEFRNTVLEILCFM